MSNPATAGFDNVSAAGSAQARPDRWLRAPRIASVRARLRALVEHALPQACALCSARSGVTVLCAPCMNALPALPPGCPVCALPSSPAGAVCGACLKRPPAYGATIAACAYAFPVDRLVQALKYERRLHVAQPLGDALAAAVLRAPATYRRADVLVPLPLARARQRDRGFNQAIEIGRVVARRVGMPIVGGLSRSGAAPPQASLPWAKRRGNVRGAFACTRSFAGAHVALVDDVMTTGATLDAAAKALMAAGAARVDAWAVARTLPPGRD